MTFSHLNDEQLAEQLAGEANQASAEHLAGCTACRAELDQMRVSLRVFNHASLEWAEHQPRVYRPAPGWRPAVVWAALCFAVLAAVLFSGILHRSPRVQVAVSSGNESTTAELTRDNALLSAIDKELDSTQLSPEKMYGIDSVKAQ